MSSVKLSIVITSYNTKALLSQCLDSISLGLEGSPSLIYEVIVVDNASTDGTIKMIEQVFPNVKLFQNSSNKGYAYAVNRGLENASGKYILLLNSDIILTHNCLLSLLNYIENNPNVGIVGPQLVYPDNNWQRSYGRIPSLSKAFFDIFFINFIEEHIKNILRKSRCEFDVRPKSVGYVDGAAMLFKKDLIREIGYFDERFFFYAEDADFCLRAHKAGLNVVFVPLSRIVHYRGGSSTAVNSAMFNIQLLRANLQLVRKYSDKFKFFLYKALIYIQLVVRYSKNWLQFALITLLGRGGYKREKQGGKCKLIRELMFAVFHWKDKNIDKKRDNS